MNIFNSLGSNYDGPMVWRSLFVPGSRRATKKFSETLAEHYQGNVALTYKGRQALQLALESSGLPKGSAVGINGFTCYVVYQAIEKAGYRPIFIDVTKGGLDFDIEGLKKAHTREKQLKAIIVQNTLGLPVDIAELETFCTKHDIIIIEDLAHSFGAKYANGRETGTVGDFTMLSFSQDKPLDVVAGGAVIDRQEKKKNLEQPRARVSLWQREINSMYPFWTALIRGTYPTGLGRYIHFGLKELHLLATPMNDNVQGLYRMEPAAANLALRRWAKHDRELNHRRAIAAIYKKELPIKLQFKPTTKSQPSYLRFPIKVDDRKSLITNLKSLGIHIGDTWYDAPIAPCKYLEKTNYKAGECPNAEDLAEHIVNLPTHRHVSEAQALSIAQEINQWFSMSYSPTSGESNG